MDMNTLNKTAEFNAWLSALADERAVNTIARRIQRAEGGNFGDCESVGEGISEMRIHYGAGYRLYYAREGSTVYLLLMGGDKQTQRRDIARAKAIWKAFRKDQS